MKNFKLILGMLLLTLSLTGCADGLAREVVGENTLVVKEVSFKNNDTWYSTEHLVEIETDEEYIVMDRFNVNYIKDEYSEEETTVSIQTIKDGVSEYEKATIHISKADVKKISKDFAKEFGETIYFGY